VNLYGEEDAFKMAAYCRRRGLRELGLPRALLLTRFRKSRGKNGLSGSISRLQQSNGQTISAETSKQETETALAPSEAGRPDLQVATAHQLSKLQHGCSTHSEERTKTVCEVKHRLQRWRKAELASLKAVDWRMLYRRPLKYRPRFIKLRW
jgi:hypothetical protein